MKNVKIWCNANKLSINFSKPNFMVVQSPRKRDLAVNFEIESVHGTSYLLERKDQVEYLGMLLDDTVSFKHHISYVASRISRSNGIIAKLRYYSIIYPYISYAILAWGCANNSHKKKIQTKQNHAVRLIFFARTLGKSTESAFPLLHLLDVLTVNNIYRLHILKFTHLWHKGLLPVLFQSYFQYASSIHGYNTRYASKQNLYKPKERTNSGKQTAFAASVLWDNIPVDLKSLNVFNFSKKLKLHLLSEQHSETLS